MIGNAIKLDIRRFKFSGTSKFNSIDRGDLPVLDELIQVFRHVFKHKVQRVVLSNHFLQLDDVRMR
jgi:hypothetical protein